MRRSLICLCTVATLAAAGGAASSGRKHTRSYPDPTPGPEPEEPAGTVGSFDVGVSGLGDAVLDAGTADCEASLREAIQATMVLDAPAEATVVAFEATPGPSVLDEPLLPAEPLPVVPPAATPRDRKIEPRRRRLVVAIVVAVIAACGAVAAAKESAPTHKVISTPSLGSASFALTQDGRAAAPGDRSPALMTWRKPTIPAPPPAGASAAVRFAPAAAMAPAFTSMDYVAVPPPPPLPLHSTSNLQRRPSIRR
jgi:hypothetical protein